MSTFKIKTIKIGFESSGFDYFTSICDITADKKEDVIVLPSEFDGNIITHLGYEQDFLEAHEHFHDWHHPSQGSEWVEKEYKFKYKYFELPKSVKKIIIPSSITNIANFCFAKCKGIDIEVALDNPTYYCKDRVIYHKSNDYPYIKLK